MRHKIVNVSLQSLVPTRSISFPIFNYFRLHITRSTKCFVWELLYDSSLHTLKPQPILEFIRDQGFRLLFPQCIPVLKGNGFYKTQIICQSNVNTLNFFFYQFSSFNLFLFLLKLSKSLTFVPPHSTVFYCTLKREKSRNNL